MKIISVCLLLVMFCGCATGGGGLSVVGAAKANNAVSVAMGLLNTLDSFYDGLMVLKIVPDYTQQATQALSMADVAAAALRLIIAGVTAPTDAELNVLAGQVAGAQAILKTVK